MSIKDVRLLDTITIKYGPIGLLSRFFLEADQYVRDRGISLVVRHDMDELAWLNEREVANGNWHPLVPAFNSNYHDLTSENSFWIAGKNSHGEIVTAHAGRMYRWHETSLADHVQALLYPNPEQAKEVYVDCPTAHLVRGSVFFGGGAWIHPGYRRHGIGTTAARIARAYAAAGWGVEWLTCFVLREEVEKKMHLAYGYSEATFSIKAPGSPWGDADLALLRQNVLELLAQIEDFLASDRVRKAA